MARCVQQRVQAESGAQTARPNCVRVVFGDIDSFAAFSLDIERWHGDAHMAIGMGTGTPMMDPAQNIFYLPFWRAARGFCRTPRLRSGTPGPRVSLLCAIAVLKLCQWC